LADQLRDRGSAHMLPSSGGIFVSERIAAEADTTVLQGAFAVGMHDFFGNTRNVTKTNN